MGLTGLLPGIFALSCGLLACGPPATLSHRWATTTPLVCDRPGELTIQDDRTGKLELPMGCERTCGAAVSIRSLGEGRFDLKVVIETPDICEMRGGGTRDNYQCALVNDGSELVCANLHRWRR